MFAIALLILFSIFHPHIDVLSLQTKPNQDFSYMQFVHNAQDKPPNEEYDYIIVGGGTAGCSLAATLSSSNSNFSILLVERGNDPQVFPYLLNRSGLKNPIIEDDNGSSPVQRFVSDEGVEYVRGRVLGGTSMINKGFYSRANPEFFNRSGVDWDMDMVEKAYQWVEEAVVFQPSLSPLQPIFKKALLEAGLVPDNGCNLNSVVGTRTPGSIFDSNGMRHGAVEFLNKANPQNLQVVDMATVEKIIFSTSGGLSATGVLYSDSKGGLHKAVIREKGEIILSAGAIGSPQLLLLSGVGNKSYLSSLKLPVLLDQPLVGQFLSDNPVNRVSFSLPPELGDALGMLCQVFADIIFQIIPIIPSNIDVNLVASDLVTNDDISNPSGSVRLASSYDVKKNPKVQFNYFTDTGDLARCVRGLHEIGDVLNTPTMKEIQGKKGFKFIGPPLPANMSDEASVGEYCRNTVTTAGFFHGGCLVGKVVDGNHRVIGMKNLRVVDGSTFLDSPGLYPMATVMMLGRYVGLKMLQQRSG